MANDESAPQSLGQTQDFDLNEIFDCKMKGLVDTFFSISHDKVLVPEGVKPERFLLAQLAPYSREDEFCFAEDIGTDPIDTRTIGLPQGKHLLFGTMVRLNRRLSDTFDSIDSEGPLGILSSEEYESYRCKSPKEIWLETIQEEFDRARQFPESKIFEVEVDLFSVEQLLVTLVGKLM